MQMSTRGRHHFDSEKAKSVSVSGIGFTSQV